MLKQRVLQNRAFRDLWIGQAISQLGDSMYYLVFLYMADHVSKNPMVVGMVGALAAVPFVIFGPFAGIWVDRADRRKLMLGADVASGSITAVLAVYAFLNPQPQVWVLAAAAFLMSTVNTVFMPARSASIPRLVDREQVLEANSLTEATRQLVAMVGIAVSAVGLGALYVMAPGYFFPVGVVANSLTFFASAWFIRRLPALEPLKDEQEEAEVAEKRGVVPELIDDLKVGVRTIVRDPILRLALPISMVSTIGVAGFFVVYLALNRAWYDGEYATIAWIEFSFAVPMMLMSLWVSKRMVVHPGRWLVLGQVGIGVMVALMALSRPYWAMLTVNALCGIFLPLMIIPMQSYMQLAVADQMRGRVNSAYFMISQAMNPLGVALTGPMLKFWGIEACLFVMGGLLSLAGVIGWVSNRFMNTVMPKGDAQAA